VDVLKQDHDEQSVTFEGVIVGEVNYETVLFWDGTVVRITEDIVADPAVAPDAPWKVSPTDGIE